MNHLQDGSNTIVGLKQDLRKVSEAAARAVEIIKQEDSGEVQNLFDACQSIHDLLNDDGLDEEGKVLGLCHRLQTEAEEWKDFLDKQRAVVKVLPQENIRAFLSDTANLVRSFRLETDLKNFTDLEDKFIIRNNANNDDSGSGSSSSGDSDDSTNDGEEEDNSKKAAAEAEDGKALKAALDHDSDADSE